MACPLLSPPDLYFYFQVLITPQVIIVRELLYVAYMGKRITKKTLMNIMHWHSSAISAIPGCAMLNISLK